MSHRTTQSLLHWCLCPAPRAGTISNKEAYYKHTICPTTSNTSSVPPWLVMILMDLLVAFLQGEPYNLPNLEVFYFSCCRCFKIYRGLLFLFLTILTHCKPRRKIPLYFQERAISISRVCHTVYVLHELIIEGAYGYLFTRTGWIVIKSVLGTCFLPWSIMHQDCFNCRWRNHHEAVPNASTCCKWLSPCVTLQQGLGTSANICHYLRHACQNRTSL